MKASSACSRLAESILASRSKVISPLRLRPVLHARQQCPSHHHVRSIPDHVSSSSIELQTPSIGPAGGGSSGRGLARAAAAGLACFAGMASSEGSAAVEGGTDWSVLPITGDGRCLFRALAQGAHLAHCVECGQPAELMLPAAEGEAADVLRGAVCDALLERKDEMAAFIDGDEAGGGSYEDYCARMRRPSTWGGEPEIAVAARLLRRPVSVYTQERRPLWDLRQAQWPELTLVSKYEDGKGGGGGKLDVPLLFHGAGHYDLLLRPPSPQRSKL